MSITNKIEEWFYTIKPLKRSSQFHHETSTMTILKNKKSQNANIAINIRSTPSSIHMKSTVSTKKPQTYSMKFKHVLKLSTNWYPSVIICWDWDYQSNRSKNETPTASNVDLFVDKERGREIHCPCLCLILLIQNVIPLTEEKKLFCW